MAVTRPLRDTDRRVFRSGVATASAIVAVVVAALLLVDAAVRAGVGEMLLLAPWILLGLWAVAVLAWAPHVETDAAGIRIRNILRIAEIPWGRVADIRLRWALEVETLDGRRVRAWGGPVAAKPARPSPFRRDARAEAPGVREMELVREEWDAHRGDPVAAPVVIRYDLPTLAVLGALLVWAIAAVLITGGAR